MDEGKLGKDSDRSGEGSASMTAIVTGKHPPTTHINHENQNYTLRAKIAITPEESFAWSEINQNLLLGLVWNILRGTPYEKLHDQRGFKFFTFSELFPFGDFRQKEPKYMIISSPDERFIQTVAEKIGDGFKAKLGSHPVTLHAEKVFKLRVSSTWESASPVVVREDDGTYWREDKDTLGEFTRLLEKNALAKYEAYHGEQLQLEAPLFERYEFMKAVVHSFRKRTGEQVLIIGSKWRFGLPKGWRKYRKFYEFLMDCGIGEKNAMGYGFVNPVRRGGGKRD